MDPIKVNGITNWPTPTNLTKLRSFLGFGNYYKDFIQNYSAITRPLHDLTKKLATWHWDDAQDTAFKTLKGLFTSYPILRVPHGYGFTRGFQATGPTVTVTVPDIDTRSETVPVAAVSWYTLLGLTTNPAYFHKNMYSI
jgi:hypothetical protein